MAHSSKYEALRSRFDTITSAIVHNVQDVASKAFSENLISQSNLHEATNEKDSTKSRSIALLSQILSSIESKESNFDVFNTILRELPVTRDLADQISESVNPKPLIPIAGPFTSGLTDTQVEKDPTEVVREKSAVPEQTLSPKSISLCPCGKCSIEKYLNHQCPKMSKDRYPYLDMSGLDEAAQTNLIARLDTDLDKICKQFANLVTSTCKSLHSENVSPHILTTCVLSIASSDSKVVHKPLTERQEEELKKATSIPEKFNELHHNWSFFNYEILEHIINNCGTDQDRMYLQKYLTEFEEFCNRSAFEVPPHVYGQVQGDITDRRILAVKLTNRLDNTLQSVQNAKRKIAQILGIPLSCLFLFHVDKGCVQLVFLIPSSVAEEVFPLSHECSSSLLENEILIISTAKKSYNESAFPISEQHESMAVQTGSPSHKFKYPSEQVMKPGRFELRRADSGVIDDNLSDDDPQPLAYKKVTKVCLNRHPLEFSNPDSSDDSGSRDSGSPSSSTRLSLTFDF